MNLKGTYHIYYGIHIYIYIYDIYDKYKLIITILCEFMRICSNSIECANFVRIVRIVRICLDFVYYANFVQIVRILCELCKKLF